MLPRKRLDLTWTDLAFALGAALTPGDPAAAARRVEERVDPRRAFACLSVRTGFDLALAALALPRGSEVLVSALTIPDMVAILERHGLVPVPVDVDPGALAPSVEGLERASTPRTRAILVAHLFGSRIDLGPLAEACRDRGWVLFEDAAQAYEGDGWWGSEAALVSMFSFGPIKTATALGGAVLVVRDPELLARMRVGAAALPVGGRVEFLRRVLKYAAIHALTTPLVYGPFFRAIERAGRDPDDVLAGAVRGFGAGDLFRRMARRPSVPLARLLVRRLDRWDRGVVRARRRSAEALIERLPGARFAGAGAPSSHWVVAALADDPDALVRACRAAGFDATRRATMRAVPPPAGRPRAERAERFVQRLVYLPVAPDLDARDLDRLAAIVRRFSDEGVAGSDAPRVLSVGSEE